MVGVGHVLLKGAMTSANARERDLVSMLLAKSWFGADELVQTSLKVFVAWYCMVPILSISLWGRTSMSFLTMVQAANFMVAGALERPDASWSCWEKPEVQNGRAFFGRHG